MIQYDQQKTISIDDGILAWVDEATGLMWEIKNLDNVNLMYVWHKSYVKNIADDITTKYQCNLENDVKDCTSYVSRLNNQKYAGFEDWRLPTVKELESLIEKNTSTRKIKKPLLHNTCAAYWTDTPVQAVNVYSSRFSHWKDTAYIPAIRIVDFSDASTRSYEPTNTLWVRSVRSIDQ